jgi:hypothetical protein
MKFLLVLAQKGEGCDYAIECGVAVRQIDALNMDDAFAKLRAAAVEGDDSLVYLDLLVNDERELESAVLYRIADEVALPLDLWRAHLHAMGETECQQQTEAAERAELARLKAKFER